MGRGDGRKIETITVEHDGRKVSFSLRMKKVADATLFVVRHFQDDPPLKIRVEGADIDEVRQAARDQAKQQMSLRWVPFLYIAVEGSSAVPLKEAEAGITRNCDLRIKYRVVEVADRPDGRGTYWRYAKTADEVEEGHYYFTGYQIENGLPDTGLKPDKSEKWERPPSHLDEMRSLIPDNEANRAAVDSIVDAVEHLRKRLKDFLSPEEIIHTLTNLSQIKLLGEPEGNKEGKQ